MSIVGDSVEAVVEGVAREVRGKRARRRRRALTPAERLRRIEKLLKPARKQTSRRRTARTRSTVQRQRVRARTKAHRRSLRVGKARR